MVSTHPEISLLQHAFYFMRHGETESNLRGTIAGSTDVALTPKGHDQARAAALMLRGHGIDVLCASPLSRAHETAEYIATELGLPITVIAELAERNWGELEGQPRSVRVRGVTPPTAEPSADFLRRVSRGLRRVPPAGTPLIVAHSGVFRVLCRILGIVESEAPVANAHPVRFTPGATPQAPWRMQML